MDKQGNVYSTLGNPDLEAKAALKQKAKTENDTTGEQKVTPQMITRLQNL
ncbi:MAG: hypothetical protein ACOCXT_00055 [Candidatus Dojkabacteria bacterium]